METGGLYSGPTSAKKAGSAKAKVLRGCRLCRNARPANRQAAKAFRVHKPGGYERL